MTPRPAGGPWEVRTGIQAPSESTEPHPHLALANVGTILSQRLRRWPSIEPALAPPLKAPTHAPLRCKSGADLGQAALQRGQAGV